jgi:hypothetical protein
MDSPNRDPTTLDVNIDATLAEIGQMSDDTLKPRKRIRPHLSNTSSGRANSLLSSTDAFDDIHKIHPAVLRQQNARINAIKQKYVHSIEEELPSPEDLMHAPSSPVPEQVDTTSSPSHKPSPESLHDLLLNLDALEEDIRDDDPDQPPYPSSTSASSPHTLNIIASYYAETYIFQLRIEKTTD